MCSTIIKLPDIIAIYSKRTKKGQHEKKLFLLVTFFFPLLSGTENVLKMLNLTTNTSGNHCIYSDTITKQVIPLAYGFIFLGGILLNGAAAWVFHQVPSKTTFVIYLKNIVMADIIMSLTFPFKILADAEIGPWQLNAIVCRFSAVLFYLNMYINITLFGLLGLDRCYKVMKPQFTTSVHAVRCSKILCVVIWLLQMLVSLPNMILTDKMPIPPDLKSCVKLKSDLGRQWHTVSNYICIGIFWTVFLLLIISYSSIARKIYISHRKFKRNSKQRKKKTNQNIFAIMLVFVICFVPYHICRIPYTLSQISLTYNCQSGKILFYMKEITLLLSAANICLDPIIYIFLCQPFKERLYRKLHFKMKTTEELENSRSRKSNLVCETAVS